MSDSLWKKIDEIFPLVADLPAAERELRLREICAGDEALRREILALLEADEKAADFWETPAVLPNSLSNAFALNQMNAVSTHSLAGEKIGAYRLDRKIGAGGMGTVYLAVRDDGAFQKKVAIKFVRHDSDTDFNLRRFRHERQVLAALEHPRIARLIDGGTTAGGLPYFVMEYVEGATLFDYCNSRQADLTARLGLFRQICAAVGYAHDKQIIHRDLKPGNILVTEDGAVKLLDFGIAKILDAGLVDEPVAQTETFLRQMTPEYASPEQIKGEEITPASDVYSLGVILYELVTGERPYKFPSRAPHEIARVICEEKIRLPDFKIRIPNSEDLSFILLKSLQKMPDSRYPSVEALDSDIEKFIAGLPVRTSETWFADEKATGDFVSPVTDKIQTVGKNKIRVAVAAAVFICLTLLGAANFRFGFFKNSNPPAEVLPAAAEKTEQNQEKSLSADPVANDLYLSGKRQLAMRTADGLNKAIEFFGEAARRDPNFALAFAGLADAQILIAVRQEKPSEGAYRKAEESAVKALALDPDLAEARVSLGMAKFRITRDFAQSEKHFLRAIELDPKLAAAHYSYASVLSETDRGTDALREMRAAAELEPHSAVIFSGLAKLLMRAKRYPEAIAAYDKAIENDNSFVTAYFWKSLLEQYQGKYETALDTYRKARIYNGKDETEPLWMLMQAEAHAAAGRRAEALKVLNRFRQGADYRREPAVYASEIALVYHLLGETEESFAWLEKVKIENAAQAKLLIEDPRLAGLQADPRFVALTERWQARK
jgi:serine/threonine protein kinase/Tfp pilus assembly protein PilF